VKEENMGATKGPQKETTKGPGKKTTKGTKKKNTIGTPRNRNDFLNFIIDAETDPDLLVEFLKNETADTIYNFFQEKGYKDIPYNDCTAILVLQQGAIGKSIPGPGRKICPGSEHGY
jgi:hypothetical protein